MVYYSDYERIEVVSIVLVEFFLFLLSGRENNYWKLKELSDVNPSSHCVRIVAGNGIRCLNGASLCALVRFPLSTVRKVCL